MQPDDPSGTVGNSSDIDVRLEQIAKISQNARTAWFGLLALVVFVGVTLMGHKDSDFFAFGAETELPLVNISVPTVSFFIVAPALTAALYVYLHIYLHNLWVALARCPPRLGKDPLEVRAYPAMLCSAALAIRRRLRSETGEPVEGSRAATIMICGLMVWLLGPLVLAVLWWRSMPYHHEWLTLWAGFSLGITVIAGGASLFDLFYLMRFGRPFSFGPSRHLFAEVRRLISGVFLLALALVSFGTTGTGYPVSLVSAQLAGDELSRKPANWLPYDIWLEDWEHQFRVRECPVSVRSGGPCPDDKLQQFKDETAERWEALTQSLDSPNLRGADLREGKLFRAFMSGANLRDALLDGADLRVARLEGADLRGAVLEGADLGGAALEGAKLVEAQLKDANLLVAQLKGADLTEARLENASLSLARLEGANLSRARLKGANFSLARLEGADLGGAHLEGANFSLARLESADLGGAHLEGANFSLARLEGADLSGAHLEGTDLRWARGLIQAQLDRACGDQQTLLPAGLVIPVCNE